MWVNISPLITVQWRVLENLVYLPVEQVWFKKKEMEVISEEA